MIGKHVLDLVAGIGEPVRSVGTPGPAVDPYLFILLTVFCIALLVLGIGSFIVLYFNVPQSRKSSDKPLGTTDARSSRTGETAGPRND
jgi:hypothetical protein